MRRGEYWPSQSFHILKLVDSVHRRSDSAMVSSCPEQRQRFDHLQHSRSLLTRPSCSMTALYIYTALLLVLATVFVAFALLSKLDRVFGGVFIPTFGLGGREQRWMSQDSDNRKTGEPTSHVASPEQPQNVHFETSALLTDDGISPATVVCHIRVVRHHLTFHICQLFIDFAALTISEYVLSHSASAIADALHLSGTVFETTVLSFATELREKFIAVMGGSRGHGGIVVANTAGKNLLYFWILCLIRLSGGRLGGQYE